MFHVLALLGERNAKLHGEIRALLNAAWSTLSVPRLGYRALESLLEVVCGNDDKARQALAQANHLLDAQAPNPLAAALASLAHLHVDSEGAASASPRTRRHSTLSRGTCSSSAAFMRRSWPKLRRTRNAGATSLRR